MSHSCRNKKTQTTLRKFVRRLSMWWDFFSAEKPARGSFVPPARNSLPLAMSHFPQNKKTQTTLRKFVRRLSMWWDFFSAEKPARGSGSPPDFHSLPLASSPTLNVIQNKKSHLSMGFPVLVPVVGLEPTRHC